MPGERSAIDKVWFTFEMHTRKFGGSMLHWVTKPGQAAAHVSASGDLTVTTKYG